GKWCWRGGGGWSWIVLLCCDRTRQHAVDVFAGGCLGQDRVVIGDFAADPSRILADLRYQASEEPSLLWGGWGGACVSRVTCGPVQRDADLLLRIHRISPCPLIFPRGAGSMTD